MSFLIAFICHLHDKILKIELDLLVPCSYDFKNLKLLKPNPVDTRNEI